MITTTTFILDPPLGRYSLGSLAKRLHPALPSRATPAAPAPATFRKSLRVNACCTSSSPHKNSELRLHAAAHSKRNRLLWPEEHGVLRRLNHVRSEGFGELVYGGELSGILPLHVLHELLLGGEVHLGVALFLFA